MQASFENFLDTLKWLAAGGSVVVISWCVSWGLEGVAFWHKLDSKVRAIIILLCSVGLGSLAVYILQMSPEQFAKLEPFGKSILATVGAWLTLQGFHFLDKKRRGEISSTNEVNREENKARDTF